MFLQVALAAIHRGELPVVALLLTFRRVQPVFLFEFFGDRLAAAVLVAVVYLPALAIDPEGNDVDVPALYVFVLEDDKG